MVITTGCQSVNIGSTPITCSMIYEICFAYDVEIYHVDAENEDEAKEMMEKDIYSMSNPKIELYDGYNNAILSVREVKEK